MNLLFERMMKEHGKEVMDISYCDLPVEAIDQIQPLWEKLNEHHRERAPRFSEEFAKRTFAMRKKEMTSEGKRLKVFVAKDSENHQYIGYCIVSLKEETREGEIESIFMDGRYRGAGIGAKLMQQALDWLTGLDVAGITIRVAVGNEEALPFYEKFGFFPRVYGLKRNYTSAVIPAMKA